MTFDASSQRPAECPGHLPLRRRNGGHRGSPPLWTAFGVAARRL